LRESGNVADLIVTAEKSEVELTDPPVLVGITQHVTAVAFGSPSEAQRLGRAAVVDLEEDLELLSDS
jgi:hypothetical protein